MEHQDVKIYGARDDSLILRGKGGAVELPARSVVSEAVLGKTWKTRALKASSLIHILSIIRRR